MQRAFPADKFCGTYLSLMTNFDIHFDHVLGKRQPYLLPTSAESMVVLGTGLIKFWNL